MSLPAEMHTLILTSIGTIEADIVNLDSDEETASPNNWRKLIFKGMLNGVTISRNNSIIDWERENDEDKLKLINDSSFVLLSNATIIPYSNPDARFEVGEMVLFTD